MLLVTIRNQGLAAQGAALKKFVTRLEKRQPNRNWDPSAAATCRLQLAGNGHQKKKSMHRRTLRDQCHLSCSTRFLNHLVLQLHASFPSLQQLPTRLHRSAQLLLSLACCSSGMTSDTAGAGHRQEHRAGQQRHDPSKGYASS